MIQIIYLIGLIVTSFIMTVRMDAAKEHDAVLYAASALIIALWPIVVVVLISRRIRQWVY